MMKLLLDMDGVITDFVGGVCRVFKVDKWELYEHWEPGVYDCVIALGKILGRKITDDEFWDKIDTYDKTPMGFWKELKPYPWTFDLVELIETRFEEWYICTSPSTYHGCASGKVWWLQQTFGRNFRKYIITPHKGLLANSNTVLLDDSEKKVRKFCASGGRAILFPRHWNSMGNMNEIDLMQYVKNEIQKEIGKAE